MSIIYKGSDNVITLDALTNTVSSAFINNATVTLTLKDADGDVITGTSSITMSYVAASDGKYRATLPDTLALTVGEHCTAEVTADGGDGLLGLWKLRLYVRDRTTKD